MEKSKKERWSLKLSAALTTGMLIGSISDVQAGGFTGGTASGRDFTDVTTNITNSTSTLPNLITTMAYIGGIGLGVAGILKLKGHVDNPAQVPLKDGLVRLGAGGGLLALPIVMEVMTGTVGSDGAGVALTNVGAITYGT